LPAEIGWVVLALPIWAFFAQLGWRLLPRELPVRLADTGLPIGLWHGIVLTWIIGVGLLVTAGLLAHAGRRRMSRQQALLIMQDVLWQETGREQRRINSGLARARGRRRETRP
jgi:hypothetical protein